MKSTAGPTNKLLPMRSLRTLRPNNKSLKIRHRFTIMSTLSYENTRGPLESGLPKASLACTSCRRQKRKCDKALPGCGLCVRMGRNCDYSAPSSTPTADDFNALRLQLQELENRLNHSNSGSSIPDNTSLYTPATTLSGSHGNAAPIYIQQDPAFSNIQNRFPVIAFLDSEAFNYGQISVPKATVEIPVVRDFTLCASMLYGGGLTYLIGSTRNPGRWTSSSGRHKRFLYFGPYVDADCVKAEDVAQYAKSHVGSWGGSCTPLSMHEARHHKASRRIRNRAEQYVHGCEKVPFAH